MHLTASAYSFEVLPLEACLSIVHHMGFRTVDLSGFHARGRASVEPEAIAADPAGEAAKMRALLDKYSLHCSDFFPQFGTSPSHHSLNDPDPAVRARCFDLVRACADFCQRLDIGGMTLLPGVDHPSRKHEDNLALSGEGLRRAAEIAGEYGVEIRFEPHMGSVAQTPELAIRLVTEFAPAAKITLDYSHFTLQYIAFERIHAMIPYTGHVHVRPSRMGKLQTRWVENTIPWADVIERLRATGYAGALSLEYVCADWFDLNQVDTLVETWATKDALLPLVGSI
jgi:sugar phosphate isomerase/epimerase